MSHSSRVSRVSSAEPSDRAARGADDRSFMQIEEVAERTGLTRRTLRYYEEIGLLAPPARTEGGYRLYSPEDLARVEHIRELRDVLGLSLKEIQEMVAAEDELDALRAIFRTQSEQRERLATVSRGEDVTRRQLDLIASKMRALSDLNARLQDRLDRYQRLWAELQEDP